MSSKNSLLPMYFDTALEEEEDYDVVPCIYWENCINHK